MNKTDPRARFSDVAGDYALYRPTYPSAAVDWIARRSGVPAGGRIVDLGCGTGISARLFAARGFSVTGVDPNEEMLARARAAGGGPRYVGGEAARTGLPDASADLATAAQAFHWFDLAATQRELRRLLVPSGRCAAFWNVRASTPLFDEYEALLRRLCPEYLRLPRPAGTIAALEALPGVSRIERADFTQEQSADREAFFGRVRSSSYVAHGVADRAAFDAELGELFERHARGGRVTLVYETKALLFRP